MPFKYFTRGQHLLGLRSLIRNNTGVAHAFRKLATEIVRKEINTVVNKRFKSVFRKSCSDKLLSFNWDGVFKELTLKCPLLQACLLGACTTQYGQCDITRGTKQKVTLKPLIGSIFGQVVFARNPYRMNNFQHILALELWMGGCAREVFGRFNRLGLSISIKSCRNTIDKLIQDFDKEVCLWRDEISTDTQPKIVRRKLFETEDIKKTPLALPLDIDVLDTSLDETLLYSEEDPNPVCGYSITFDNVNQKTHARHTTRDNQNKMFNMVQAYSAKNRIPTWHLDNTTPSAAEIDQIPYNVYLPSYADHSTLRKEYKVMIQRIMVENIPAFSSLHDTIIWHIPHDYSKESANKSRMFVLGVLDKDESRVADMVDILDEYHKYVPKCKSNPKSVLLFGDGLSCERVVDAQSARINSRNPWSRLEGFEAAAQEWHKKVIILTDTYELLYKPSSARESGTLYNIRNTFKHKNIKKNIMHCVNHAVDLLNFSTKSYVIGAACHFMSCENIPRKSPCSQEELYTYYEQISEQVTELAFHPMDNMAIVSDDDGGDDDQYDVRCDICKLDYDGDWIQCEFISCSKWFHYNCYGLLTDKIPEGEWFCCEMCKAKKNTMVNISESDGILEYTKAVMWRGIGHMVRSDAVRENDGLRMILHWRYDMIDFYQHHHPKYFIFGFRLLTNINGGICERLKQDLIWNRTVNTSGGPGKNIAMDLQMEHFNNEYKTSVKSSGGQLTDATIARYSKMIGIRKELCKCFDQHIAFRKSDYRKSGSIKQAEDIKELVSTLLRNNVFSFKKSRSYHGFENFQLSTSVKNEEAFNKRIQKHKNLLIKKRNIIIDS